MISHGEQGLRAETAKASGRSRPLLPLVVLLVLAATSQPAPAAGGTANQGEPVRGDPVQGDPVRDDPVRGQRVFAICGECHSLAAGTNKYGPSLHGLIGRRAGSVADFDYSDAMAQAGLTWDDATLDKYLADPQAVVPGNRMPFDGLPDAHDRAALIAYLDQAAGKAP